jgi:putative endonuclease
MLRSMKYVYLLESVSNPGQTYVGLTDDLKIRFEVHNSGGSPHTAKYKPWRLVTYLAFADEAKGSCLRAIPEVRVGSRICQ